MSRTLTWRGKGPGSCPSADTLTGSVLKSPLTKGAGWDVLLAFRQNPVEIVTPMPLGSPGAELSTS